MHIRSVCSVSGIRGVLRTVTVFTDSLYVRSTSVFSALEVCYENALCKFTFDIDIDVDNNCNTVRGFEYLCLVHLLYFKGV